MEHNYRSAPAGIAWSAYSSVRTSQRTGASRRKSVMVSLRMYPDNYATAQ